MSKEELHMDVQPFTIAVAQPALDDLHLRLAMTRLPDDVPGTGWGFGTDLAYLRDLVHYWRSPFPRRAPERAPNPHPPFRAQVRGIRVRFTPLGGVGPPPGPPTPAHRRPHP